MTEHAGEQITRTGAPASIGIELQAVTTCRHVAQAEIEALEFSMSEPQVLIAIQCREGPVGKAPRFVSIDPVVSVRIHPVEQGPTRLVEIRGSIALAGVSEAADHPVIAPSTINSAAQADRPFCPQSPLTHGWVSAAQYPA